MQENKPIFYIPNTVQIGCTNKLTEKLLKSVGLTSDMDKIGLPSCRYMMNKWTDINLFEKITGFRPTNMINKEKEIKKMLTGSVFELDNVPTSGFKLVDIQNNSLYPQASYLSYGRTYAYIYDPRGFVFSVLFSNFWNSLIKNNISIDKDKTISGRFVYSWKESCPNSNVIDFTLIHENDMVSTSEYDVIKEKDIINNRKEKPGIKAKDFIPGTIYDYNNNGVIERVLFVGKYNMYSLTALKKFYTKTFGGNLYRMKESFFSKTQLHYIYNTCDPSIYFNENDYNDFIKLMDRSKKYNVFLTLSPQYSYYTNNFINMMCINNNPDPDDWYRFSFFHNIRFLNGGINIIKVSDNQQICLDDSKSVNVDKTIYQMDDIIDKMKEIILTIDNHINFIKSKFEGKTTDEIINIVKHLEYNDCVLN